MFYYIIIIIVLFSEINLGSEQLSYSGISNRYLTPNINLGFTNIDVKHYRIEIEPFWNTKSIKAICTIKLLVEYEQKTGFSDNRTAVSEVPPKKSRILSIYPNPLLERTSSYIKYELSDDSQVELNCYDITGRFIGKIFEGNRKQGRYITVINNKLNLSSGVYIIELIANHERRDVRKIVVMS
ncbi:MAG: T9SS type A sorting domain-containing protein [Candidatus Coatesbacteria bacterium]|nr:T9SS type A sorting domain-containing protein [Candidatus Coatesbacteria bacterium]